MKHIRRRGFIILFGTKPVIRDDPSRTVRSRCPRCNREADLVGKSQRTWFTVFFIPLFPVSAVVQYNQCAACGAAFQAEKRALQKHANQLDVQQNQRSIAMYNQLRTSPGNSILLNDLLNLYGELEQYDSAISLAEQFPQALSGAEQPQVTLARVYLAKDQVERAVEMLDRVLSRNPDWADALLLKATALLHFKPPRTTEAITAARAARALGHEQADAVLHQAQDLEKTAQASA